MKNIFLMLALFITASIISCQSKNTREDTSPGTDSSMMAKDHTEVATSDTVTTGVTASADTSSAANTSGARPDPSKKGKKGKAQVL